MNSDTFYFNIKAIIKKIKLLRFSKQSLLRETFRQISKVAHFYPKGARSADNSCWNKLNSEADGFGTCDPTKNKACHKK